jgi:hypothetical protein
VKEWESLLLVGLPCICSLAEGRTIHLKGSKFKN